MKVLCICPIGIGNYILVYPACAALRKSNPDLRLHLLALRTPIASLADGDPLWEKIHTIDPTGKHSIGELVAFIKNLKRERFDASISFFPSNTWQYNLLPFLSGIPRRYAFNYPLKKTVSLSFLNNKKFGMNHSLHDIRQNLDIASSFTRQPVDNDRIVFPTLFDEDEKAKAEKCLKHEGTPRVKIAIHPGSSKEHGMDAKRWAPDRFGRIADRICETLNAEALIFGGSDEAELKNQTASSMKMPHRIVEKISLRLTAAMIHGCSLCLCNDSGLMHIAASMGIPVAALFGPTDERRNGPFGEKNLIIRKEMPGFPLWTAANVGVRFVPPGVDPCAPLNMLSVDEAWGIVEPWLRKNFDKCS